jgi:hypothetical protein
LVAVGYFAELADWNFLVAGAGLPLSDFCFFMIALKRQQGCRTPKVRKFKNVLKGKGVIGRVS